MHKYLITLVLLTIQSPSAQAYIVDGRAIKDPSLMTYVKNNSNNQATLKLNKAGELYLELEKGFIHKLQSKIAMPGFVSINEHTDNTMAIMPPATSLLTNNLSLIPAIGKKLEFKPLAIYLVTEDDQEYYTLAVRINALKAPNNTFNIKIAVKQLANHNELAN